MSTTETPNMRIRDIHKRFPGRPVLRGVNLDVEPGSLVGIIGENGAGKTTLLNILAGRLRPDRGQVECRSRIGYCPQRTILNDALTVDEHLRFFQLAYGLERLELANELVERLRFGDHRSARVAVLSGGTRQKLNVTLALMHDPDVLLLDEPNQSFDWETHLRFWEIAAGLRTRGRSVLVVSHLAHDMTRLDRVYRLKSGRLSPATDILESGDDALAD